MSLKDDPIIQDIQHRIDKEIVKIAESLASGSAGSFDEYKKQCGRIAGLKESLRLINDSIDKYVNDDD